MDSYVVRIYRRDGKKPRLLIGTVEAAGSGRKMAFSNTEELWGILRRSRLRKEVMSAGEVPDVEGPAEGARQTKPTIEP